MRTEERVTIKSTGLKAFGFVFTPLYALLLTGSGFFFGKDTAELIQLAVFSCIIGGTVSLCIRKFYAISETDPDISQAAEKRFLVVVFLAMLLSVLFSTFPNTMWVFVPVFVVLITFARNSNISTSSCGYDTCFRMRSNCIFRISCQRRFFRDRISSAGFRDEICASRISFITLSSCM